MRLSWVPASAGMTMSRALSADQIATIIVPAVRLHSGFAMRRRQNKSGLQALACNPRSLKTCLRTLLAVAFAGPASARNAAAPDTEFLPRLGICACLKQRQRAPNMPLNSTLLTGCDVVVTILILETVASVCTTPARMPPQSPTVPFPPRPLVQKSAMVPLAIAPVDNTGYHPSTPRKSSLIN